MSGDSLCCEDLSVSSRFFFLLFSFIVCRRRNEFLSDEMESRKSDGIGLYDTAWPDLTCHDVLRCCLLYINRAGGG